ncbi:MULTISPECIES: hypothetical protein [Streptomyces]|uniref:Uncharacterized protein n=2 Tax=Streptomyces TaxID=1883 RepID=A0A1D8G041_9ACTN|nr:MULTISPECIES: hypothetical protein [Streptomyces]AOT58824.1 hypothetical protein A4G23_01644 [Streptomyces rubrolavendulae]KAF0649769.1 hypothetical protein K701_11810 [Streptomyces fradiae ATCC 10745 = DSM 40063]OSY49675.1 hypothetical protein BG846_04726 [Streptomyces fradiae ATCC 10745 = DSM 40063]UQS28249.1 hypothetical protein J5J01_14125 [Streptomyces fradiae]
MAASRTGGPTARLATTRARDGLVPSHRGFPNAARMPGDKGGVTPVRASRCHSWS